jgi:four helix bundle protein
MSKGIRYHTDLDVWRESKGLAVSAYRLTTLFPNRETFALADQIRRAAASVPANIAEGCGRGSGRELIRFLRVARGSLSELHSHLSLASDLGYLADGHRSVFEHLARVNRMLNALIGSLKRARIKPDTL